MHVHACRQGRSDLLMAVFRGMTLRDHLCWVWRMGSDSADPVLAEAALLAAQLLRVLGVEHDSLDTMLCQVGFLPLSRARSWPLGKVTAAGLGVQFAPQCAQQLQNGNSLGRWNPSACVSCTP